MNELNKQSQIASVKVYIRNYAKKACQLILPSKVTLQQLKSMIETKMKIPASHQMLYWHSQQLQDNNLIAFDPLSIVHVINKLRVTPSQISIYIKKIGEASQTFTFSVRAEMKVRDFYDKMIMSVFDETEDWIMIYVGRRLNPDNTFIDQKVEDQSQIILVQKNYRINQKQPRSNFAEAVHDQRQKQHVGAHPVKINRLQTQANTQSTNMNRLQENPKSQQVELSSMNAEHNIESYKLQKKLTNKSSKQSDAQPKDVEGLNKDIKSNQIHTQSEPSSYNQKPQADQQKLDSFAENNQKESGQKDQYQFTVYDFLAGNNYQKVTVCQIETMKSKGANSHEFEEIMKKRLSFENNGKEDEEKNQEPINKEIIPKSEQEAKKQQAKIQSHEVLKKYEDGFQIRDLHPTSRVQKSIRKINAFNPHQCKDQSIKVEEVENQLENQYSDETNDHPLSSIKQTNSQYHNESLFGSSDQGASMNQEDFTFAFANKNWSTQLQKKQNVKLNKINAGTNLEQWKKTSISFTDNNERSEHKIANGILEDSTPIDFDCSTSGFFKEPNEASKE